MDHITLSQAENIANYLYDQLKSIHLLSKPILISESHTDKFGFTIADSIPVLTLQFKNPHHNADFYREFMAPLSLNHEPPATDLSVCTIRLEIPPEHPLLTNRAWVNSLFANVLRSIKENFIPHRHA